MPIVRFFTHLAPELAERFTAHAPPGYEVTTHPADLSEEEKSPLFQNADFLILFGGSPSDDILRSAPNLKLIQLVSAGFEHLNLDLCRELNITVANNGGANSIDVSEHTLALILGFYRHMVEQDQNVRSNRYHDLNNGLLTYTIHGKTAGVIGLGNIGQKVTRLLNAFGATVSYYDEYPVDAQIEKDLNVTRKSLPDLLASSEIVTLHVPFNESTHHLIGTEELAQMKPTTLLVNTCRGKVIDQVALTETLTQKRILGAALDVQEQEPPDPNDSILKLDNVLFTPHSAGVTFDTWSRRGEFVFQNLQAVWEGRGPLAVVS